MNLTGENISDCDILSRLNSDAWSSKNLSSAFLILYRIQESFLQSVSKNNSVWIHCLLNQGLFKTFTAFFTSLQK